VAGAASVLVVLTGGMVASTVLYLRADEARAEAERQTTAANLAKAEVQTQLARTIEAEALARERAADAERERQAQQEQRRRADALANDLEKQMDEVESRAAALARIFSEFNAFMNDVLSRDGRVGREQLLSMMDGVLHEVLAESGGQSAPALTLVRLRYTEKARPGLLDVPGHGQPDARTPWRRRGGLPGRDRQGRRGHPLAGLPRRDVPGPGGPRTCPRVDGPGAGRCHR
jgi:hypothetical protein